MRGKSLIILFLLPITVISQNFDKIKTNDNKSIECTITEINKDFILYRIEKNNGETENSKIAFKEVESIITDNKLIQNKYNEIRTEMDVPASEDVKKAMLLMAGGGGLFVLGVFTATVISNIEPIRTHKRGQVSSTGIAMATAGVGLGVLGYFQLKKAKEKVTN